MALLCLKEESKISYSCANEKMKLVDEENYLSLKFLRIAQDSPHSLFKLSATEMKR
jgi:hypothetical protein